MGTNYYLHRGVCESCGKPDEVLHIGKQSTGWAFGLHVIPELGLNDLEDWIPLFEEAGSVIVSEYWNDTLGGPTRCTPQSLGPSSSSSDKETIDTEWMIECISNGLPVQGGRDSCRHKIDGTFCVGRGKCGCDLIAGEFS